jgi:hypothetical protein
MTVIQNPRIIYFKGFLFLATGIVAGATLLVQAPSLQIAVLLAICVWCFCRFYYFAFYVIQHYVDPEYRFAGLLDFFRYMSGRSSTRGGQEVDR